MYRKPIGVSILTNSNRCGYLRTCISSLLSNCYTRPIIVGIFDNGSTDDTPDFCSSLSKPNDYGIEWRYQRSEKDLGCAAGTNAAHSLVGDCELILHLESDFRHLTESESGVGMMWLRDAVNLIDTGRADYLYLRRMRSDAERSMHWFHQWRDKIVETDGPYQRCENFWWSNNPSLFRMEALKKSGTLPLDVSKDGPKGTAGWSRPELSTPRPANTWMYGFGNGMFVHDG